MKEILSRSKFGTAINAGKGIRDVVNGDKTIGEATGDVAKATAETVATTTAASVIATTAGVAFPPVGIAVGVGYWAIKKFFRD